MNLADESLRLNTAITKDGNIEPCTEASAVESEEVVPAIGNRLNGGGGLEPCTLGQRFLTALQFPKDAPSPLPHPLINK